MCADEAAELERSTSLEVVKITSCVGSQAITGTDGNHGARAIVPSTLLVGSGCCS